MFNDLSSFCLVMETSANAGVLLPLKHDVASLSATYPNYRTVVDPSVVSALPNIFSTQACDVYRYDNMRYGGNEYYSVELSAYSVVGSGVSANSTVPTTTADRLVVVPRSDGTYHMFAASYADISADASLTNKTHLL